LKNISKKTKVFLYTKARLLVLEYGLFFAMIIAAISVVIIGADSDPATVVDYARNRTSCSILGGTTDLPIATPAVNNAVAISNMVTTVTTCWSKSAGLK